MITRALRIAAVFLAVNAPYVCADEQESQEVDIQRLLAAVQKMERAWEWSGALPEVHVVAKHGRAIAPRLVALMEHDDDPIDMHIWGDQQLQLALCEIFGERPEPQHTIYGVRVPEKDNRRVHQYWKQRVASTERPPNPDYSCAHQ